MFVMLVTMKPIANIGTVLIVEEKWITMKIDKEVILNDCKRISEGIIKISR